MSKFNVLRVMEAGFKVEIACRRCGHVFFADREKKLHCEEHTDAELYCVCPVCGASDTPEIPSSPSAQLENTTDPGDTEG